MNPRPAEPARPPVYLKLAILFKLRVKLGFFFHVWYGKTVVLSEVAKS